MKTQVKLHLFAAVVLVTIHPQPLTCFAQGTAFTYQGRLDNGGAPASGIYDLRFAIFDAAGGGSLVAGPLTNPVTALSNGLFTVSLDFGATVFDGGDRFLEIGVRPGASSGPYTTVTPRQRINPTPYAISAGAVSGRISAWQLPPEALTVNSNREIVGPVRATDPGNVFVGDGSGLRDVVATAVGPGDQVQYQSTFFRKLSTTPVLDWAVGRYGAGAAAVGDFNGDGRPDILMSLSGIGVSALYTNTTGGNVRMAGEVGIYFFPRAVAVGDFNGDGSLDIAGGDLRNNVILVITNRANGTFANMASVVASNVTALAAADVNGDGRKDLVVATAGQPARLRTFLSSGSGFVASGALDLPSDATDLAVGDLDGDSRVDVVAACVSAGKLAIYRNPAGALVAGPQLDAERPWAVAIGVFDWNPTPDLVYLSGHIPGSGGTEDWNVRFLTQNSQLFFQPAGAPYTLIRPNYISSAYGARLIVGDFNHDGWHDVIAGYGYFGQERMALLLAPRYGGGIPTFVVDWTNPGIVDFGVADFDGDTRLDLGTAVWNGSASTGAAVWLQAYDGLNVAASSQFLWDTTFNGSLTADAGLNVVRGLTTDSLNASGITTLSNATVSGALSFGSRTRQMINLWDTTYGLGVQSATLYQRSGTGPDDGFAWYKGGTHSDIFRDPGGGSRLMTLDAYALSANVHGAFYNGLTVRSGGGFSDPQFLLVQTTPGDWARFRMQSSGPSWEIALSPGAQPVLNFYNGSADVLSLSQAGDATVLRNLRFNTGALRQMIDLWAGEHAIGVQGWTTYFRTIGAPANGAFAWYKGGVHNDNYLNAGGGEELMRLTSGGLTVRGTFVSASDRAMKAGFDPVDTKAVLEKVAALPIHRWHYTNDSAVVHLGPVAQDFHAAFGLGADDKHIATVDADGVALAAIQALHGKLREQQLELDRRRKEIAELKDVLEKLRHTVDKLTNANQ